MVARIRPGSDRDERVWTVTSATALDALVGALAAQGQCRWLLLDIGGVLFPDPWETLISAPAVGLAAQLRSPRLAEVAYELWETYSVRPSSELEYWADLARLAGLAIPPDVVRRAEADSLRPYPWAAKLLRSTAAHLGLISDNTSFWYEKQARALALDSAELLVRFVSCELGATKRTRPQGLYDIAAAVLDGSRVVVVDDRLHNVERATQAGLGAVHFDWQ